MAIDFSPLKKQTRLLIRARLQPVMGDRFTPVKFPDVAEARYEDASGVPCLIVESPQSVANHLELASWDEAENDFRAPLRGLPYVRVLAEDGEVLTASPLEAHRLNSPYILDGTDQTMFENLQKETGATANRPVNVPILAKVVTKYDINSVLHGLFIPRANLAGGRLKLTRVMSGTIDGWNVREVELGGVKNDRVSPGGKGEDGQAGGAKKGFGNIPYHRSQYTAEKITASFLIDLSLLRSYRLPDKTWELLVALALYKVQGFLSDGLRLRSECDLDVVSAVVERPADFALPALEELEADLPGLVQANTALGVFATPPVTTLTYIPKRGKAGAAKEEADEEAGG